MFCLDNIITALFMSFYVTKMLRVNIILSGGNVMNSGFCIIILCVTLFLTPLLDMINILDSVSCIITQYGQEGLYFYIYSNISFLFVFCTEIK